MRLMWSEFLLVKVHETLGGHFRLIGIFDLSPYKLYIRSRLDVGFECTIYVGLVFFYCINRVSHVCFFRTNHVCMFWVLLSRIVCVQFPFPLIILHHMRSTHILLSPGIHHIFRVQCGAIITSFACNAVHSSHLSREMRCLIVCAFAPFVCTISVYVFSVLKLPL